MFYSQHRQVKSESKPSQQGLECPGLLLILLPVPIIIGAPSRIERGVAVPEIRLPIGPLGRDLEKSLWGKAGVSEERIPICLCQPHPQLVRGRNLNVTATLART